VDGSGLVLGASKESPKGIPGRTVKKVPNKNIVCKFKYIKKKETLEKIYCNIPKLKFIEESKYPFANKYSIFLKGEVVTEFYIQIDEYSCNFNLLKPSTWFKCEEEFVESKIVNLKPNMFFKLYKNKKSVIIRSFYLENNVFRILAGHVKDSNDMTLTHTYRMVLGGYDLYHEEKREYALRIGDNNRGDGEQLTNTGSRPFSFPFKKIIGVTQWYGNTAYQTPHSGIDFGATKEAVLAVADGEVVGKGWDSYNNECLSGGNYLKIKQGDNIHTTYFHLEDTYVNTGDIVKKGQVVAKSGNTGAWNCQKLGYHLHFETRLNASYKSHTNPVPYISVDWNNVPTLGASGNPGRLTGENPHPGR